MQVESLRRYPVKSMLGEDVESLFVDERGAQGDRRLALVDTTTGHVASAKQARLWRELLKCTAIGDVGHVRIGLPDGTTVAADDPDANEVLSKLLGRSVRLVGKRPNGATVERPDPEKLLELGLDADVAGRILEIGLGTPGDSFTDDAPLHAITTATLDHIGVEALRYRPNLVIATPADWPPYVENDWVERELAIGSVRLRGLELTPRCVVPTLEHGRLPKAPQALRTPAAENRLQAGSCGVAACAGIYFKATTAGTIRVGEQVTLDP